MTISEIIAKLEDIQSKYGDLYVEHDNGTLVHSATPIKQDESGDVVAVRLS